MTIILFQNKLQSQVMEENLLPICVTQIFLCLESIDWGLIP